jgi:hypothetical protein
MAEQSSTYVIKRKDGRSEPYDQQKLYTSIYSACLASHTPAGEAELTATRVCKDVLPWILSKPEITALDIRTQAANYFKLYNPDAAKLYVRRRIKRIKEK